MKSELSYSLRHLDNERSLRVKGVLYMRSHR
jgi:hypothetical protein